jgi:hypothetical protein
MNANDKLETWKEIANYVGRDLRTVMRWEKERGLPVHCIPGGGRRAVYAFRSEIDAWLLGANQSPPARKPPFPQSVQPPSPISTAGLADESRTDSTAGSAPLPVDRTVSKSNRRPVLSALRVAGLLALMAASVWVVRMFIPKSPHASLNSAIAAPIIPSGIEHWVHVSLINSQSEPVPQGFQQFIAVDSSRYASIESANLQNVAFFNDRGEILRSWMESGNSNLSSHTLYWIQLPDGMPAGKVLNIYMGFAATDRSLFNTTTTGEAPGLSSTYGGFDNGANVFPHYANFEAHSLPAGWYSGETPGGRGEVRIGDGVFIAHSGRGGGTAYLGSNWEVGTQIAEMELLTQQTTRGQEMLFVCSSSPTFFRWTPDSVGYQDMSGLEIESNNAGSPSVRAKATPNPTQSAVIGIEDGIVFANYQPVASVETRICGGDYLATAVNTGFNASFSFDWVRMRVPPPNGIMPAAVFGELESRASQSLEATKIR